jgi:hypothetical protein
MGQRRFEAVWSLDPAVVRDAADIGAALAAAHAVPLRSASLRPSADHASIVRRATAVTNRIIAYLDA